MLEGIGRVGAYVQQRNLKTAAKYRIKTGQSLIPNKTEKLQGALQKISSNQSTKHSDPIKTATIKSKLKGGRKLSADEIWNRLLPQRPMPRMLLRKLLKSSSISCGLSKMPGMNLPIARNTRQCLRDSLLVKINILENLQCQMALLVTG